MIRTALLAIALAAALVASFPPGTDQARAQVDNAGARLVPLGYQQISAATLAASTALTVPTGATHAFVQVDTAPVRWRDDGTAPTTTVGVQLAIGGTLFYAGTLSAIRFIAASGSPVLNVSYYRLAG